MPDRIAIIGSHSNCIATLTDILEGEGYSVVGIDPGEEGASSIATQPLELIILDGEPQAIERMKDMLRWNDQSQGPGRIAIVHQDKLDNYDFTLNHTDFLVWPATPGEVALRVRSALWQRTNIQSDDVIKYGDLVIDVANYKVYIAGKIIELTFKEYELLRFLATHHERVYSRESLLNQVWGYDYYGGARTVDVHIRRLRSKIEDHGHTFIETVRNVGYRFRAS